MIHNIERIVLTVWSVSMVLLAISFLLYEITDASFIEKIAAALLVVFSTTSASVIAAFIYCLLVDLWA